MKGALRSEALLAKGFEERIALAICTGSEGRRPDNERASHANNEGLLRSPE